MMRQVVDLFIDWLMMAHDCPSFQSTVHLRSKILVMIRQALLMGRVLLEKWVIEVVWCLSFLVDYFCLAER